jgi:hypothetical protein
MRDEFFSRQIERLSDQWPAAYSRERSAVLWNHLKNIPEEDFKYVVDELLGTARHAPLLKEFNDQLSIRRERSSERDKKQYAQEAKTFFKDQVISNDPQMIGTMCSLIRKRMRNAVGDQEWTSFLTGITKLAEQAPKVT